MCIRDSVTDNAYELGAVPPRGLAVSQTGAEYRAATGVGLTAKAAQGQPCLLYTSHILRNFHDMTALIVDAQHRWHTVPTGTRLQCRSNAFVVSDAPGTGSGPVSYTHLDVYKRQVQTNVPKAASTSKSACR